MARKGKSDKRTRGPAIFFRPVPEDHAELKRRQATTGAPIGAQVRILIHDALRAKGKIR